VSYVERLLAPGETVLHRTRRHWVVLMRWVGSALVLAVLGLVMASLFGLGGFVGAGVGALVGLGLVTIAVLVSLPGILRWASEVYLVTDRRVVRVSGVLQKQALDSGLAKVNDVRLEQTVAGRLLGYGTLEIITASESGINRLEYLPHPMAFKRAMMTAAEARGVSVVPVVAEGTSAAVAPSPAGAPRSPADRLADLDEMKRRGLLGDDEYRKKRDEILKQV
jgi:uncharacterized membrane protein YdbT with pleckstrin-like domain